MGSRMLQDVRQDLTDVVQVCVGKKKQTNVLRTLINDLVKGGLLVLEQILLKRLSKCKKLNFKLPFYNRSSQICYLNSF